MHQMPHMQFLPQLYHTPMTSMYGGYMGQPVPGMMPGVNPMYPMCGMPINVSSPYGTVAPPYGYPVGSFYGHMPGNLPLTGCSGTTVSSVTPGNTPGLVNMGYGLSDPNMGQTMSVNELAEKTIPSNIPLVNTSHLIELDPTGGAKLKLKKSKVNPYQLPPPSHIAHSNDNIQVPNVHPPTMIFQNNPLARQQVTQQSPVARHVHTPMNAQNTQNRQQMQVPPPPVPHQVLRLGDLPKTLKFDGSDNWKAFQTKFERYMYVELKNWTPLECRDNLCFCLEGKASEYYAIILQRDGIMGYRETMQKLEKRFGYAEIPETAQIKLQSLKQN